MRLFEVSREIEPQDQGQSDDRGAMGLWADPYEFKTTNPRVRLLSHPGVIPLRQSLGGAMGLIFLEFWSRILVFAAHYWPVALIISVGLVFWGVSLFDGDRTGITRLTSEDLERIPGDW